MSKVLPKDCDHPEESLGPLPYRAGRPPRADEWECGVCGMWNVVDEPVYTRRPVEDYVEAGPKTRPPYDHTLPCAHRQSLSPMHVASLPDHPSHMGCSCPCHHGGHYYDSSMWTWPTTVAQAPVPSFGQQWATTQQLSEKTFVRQINQLVADGKVHSVSVDMDHDGGFLSFRRARSAGLTVTAVGVATQAAVDVMSLMYDLVRGGRWMRLRWEMSKAMLWELHQKSVPPSGLGQWGPAGPMTIFGGEIVVSYDVPHNDIRLTAR